MPEVLSELVAKITTDATELKKGLSDSDKAIESFAAKTQKAFRAVGVAFTAIGATGMKMIDTSKELNAQLGATGMTVGVSTKEMRNLALATTNVTFPLKSVVATFELLAKSGVKNTTEMKNAANAFDALADATGANAEVIADLLLPAFKLFGEQIPQTSAELDKFTWLTKNTLVDLSDFGTLLTRMAPYMDDLNLSMDDAIAVLAALGEQGIVGTAATLKLRTAITQAASGAVTLNQALGLTQDEIDGYKTRMNGAIGITDKYAEQLNTQFTLLDKVKQKFSEITLSASGFLEPLEPILAAMTALGPVMIFLSTSMGISTIKMIAHTGAIIAHTAVLVASKIAIIAVTVAQWAWNVAMTANPIGILIMAITGLIAAGILLWKNWDKVTAFFGKAWQNIKIVFLTGIKVILDGLVKFAGWLPGIGNKIEQLRDKVANMLEAEQVKKDAAEIKRTAEELTKSVKAEFEKQALEIQSSFDKQKQAAQSAYDAAVKAINKEYGIGEAAKNVSETRIEAAKRATEEARKSYAREKDAAKDRYDTEMAEIRAIYSAKMEALNLETDATVKALQDQIDAIDAQTEAEDLALQRQEEAKKLATLSGKEREEFAAEIARRELLRSRSAEKNALRERIAEAQEQANKRKDQIQSETDAELASLKIRYEANIKNIDMLSERLDGDLKETLARIEQDRIAKIDAEKEKLNAEIARLDKSEQEEVKFYASQLGRANQQVKDINVVYDSLKKRYDIEIVTHGITAETGRGVTIGPFTGTKEEWERRRVKGFAQGGIVPGPVGMPQVAMVHGGETIIPVGDWGGTVNVYIDSFTANSTRDVDMLAEKIVKQIRVRTGLKS